MKKQHWLVILLFNSLAIFAQDKNLNAHLGLALEGFDAVSYFQNGPERGSEKYFATHEGIRYLFSSKENLEAFNKAPDRYLPQYGGWCAYAMGLNGEKVTVDPKTYKIIDGKLYLFYNSLLNNTLKKWNQQESELLPSANKNWELLQKQEEHE